MAAFVCSLFLFFCVSPAQQLPLAPALYAFGDSLVDAGNNNGFKTYAKYDYPPYGIDFPGGLRGRPTNGYNVADSFVSFEIVILYVNQNKINKQTNKANSHSDKQHIIVNV